MCAIFNDVWSLICDTVKLGAHKLYNSKKAINKSVFALVAVIAIFASLTFTGVRIAYKVNYNDKVIATVASKQQFNRALQMVVDLVDANASEVEDAVSEPQFNTAIILNEDIDTEQQVADAIIENTDEIVAAASLVVDGRYVACVDEAELELYLDEYLNRFAVDGISCTCEFAEDVTIETGIHMARDIQSVDSLEETVSALTVITKAQQTTDVIVPYDSTVEKNDEKVVGYKSVTVKGVSGVNRVTQDVILVNGVELSRTDVATEVITNPVNEVVVVGTAPSVSSAKQKAAAHSAGFIFPLPAGSWQVSAYYGDGRNHKGMDLRAPSGTSIFAVAGGTVVKAAWDGAYGYSVVIDHGNGITTRYAHASRLCCSAGDTVSAGQVIALVGTTGQSTGNHLHIEVAVNGRKVNPAAYIGLD